MLHDLNIVWRAYPFIPDSLIFYNLNYTFYYCPHKNLCLPIFNFILTFVLSQSHIWFFMYLLTVLHLASFTVHIQTVRLEWLNIFHLRTTLWKKVFISCISCIYLFKFIFLIGEPSF